MKLHTNEFKQQSKLFGNRINAEIHYDSAIIDKKEINSLKFAFNTELFKTIMKQVAFDINEEIPQKTWVNPKFGYKVGSNYEMLDYGTYYINDKAEYSADNKAYTHIAYDSMIESMIPFDESPLEIEYPISYGDMLRIIATKLGWTFTQKGFPNENTMIEYDLYSGLGLTYRDILDDLCPASMGNIIVTDNKEMQIIYATETDDVIDATYLNEDNVNIGKKIGPINALVLTRAEGGDSIYRRDEDSIISNDLQEIKISDNLLLSSSFRENFIDEMFDKIKGFQYYEIDIKTVGLAYYDLLDRFTINLDGNSYSTVVLNCDLTLDGGVEEILYSPALEEVKTDYTVSGITDKGQKIANIIAYKNQARIEMITEEVNEATSKVTSMEQTVDGFTNTVSKVDNIAEEISELKQASNELILNFKKKTKNPNLMDNSSGFFGLQGFHNYIEKGVVFYEGEGDYYDLPDANLINAKYLIWKDAYIENIGELYEKVASYGFSVTYIWSEQPVASVDLITGEIIGSPDIEEKYISDLIKLPLAEFKNTSINISTHRDEKYDSKNKFVLDTAYFINPKMFDFRDYIFCYKPFNVPSDLKQLFFSIKYKESFKVGNLKLTIYQLKDNFNDYMYDNTYTTWKDKITKHDVINLKQGFGESFNKIEQLVEVNEETNQIMVVIEPEWYVTGTFYPIENQSIRDKLNDLFVNYIRTIIFENYSTLSLWSENFIQKKITYFISEEEPDIPLSLEDFDFSNIWLCEKNIYDENDVLIYEKDMLYALETNIDYETGEYEILGWQKLNITKEQIDNGYEHHFFVGWNRLVEKIHGTGAFEQIFSGSIEFGDIMFSTINYEWAPAKGESAIDTEFKFNNKGMYIENNEEGFRREISASKDISTNIQTGENTWFLTPQGQWVKLLEAKEIRMGNFHIVEENDEINFYYRGGN